MFEWLKRVNQKDLKKDPGLQKNQPKDGILGITNDTEVDGSISIDLEEKKIESANISVIKRF